MILSLFKKEKEKIQKALPKNWLHSQQKNFETKVFTETLKLKPEQIELFLQFCDADPKSKH
jgi:hypothetical protein